MPPSPGRIHSLPVKVLYSIDTSPQSFLTILPDRQEVYVHSHSGIQTQSHGPAADHGAAGSCTLKAVGRGICFASPECIPNAATLDFSVYNLDPSAGRGGGVTARAFSPSTDASSSSWTGRGFLSWALTEPGQGTTLIKGRLVREYEFAASHFAAEGGLEGLMAAASRGGGSREDQDGKGWGLEVAISLRQLNPEGKVEFQGRKEFEDMLANGKSLSLASGTGPAATPSSIPRSSPHPARATPTTTQPQAGPSSAATVRPTLAQPSPVHPLAAPSRPSSSVSHRPSFSSTLPPSSLPPGPSSSASNIPSSRPSSAADSRPQVKAEPAKSQPSREITPPPVARPKSPPPSTPSRARLHALLRADGAMSPDLARHLASNPVLRNLLKAVPSNSNALAALRNITGINNPPGDKGKQRANGDEEKEGSPEQATTPTPSNNVPQMRSTTEGCCNCGTMQSNCWRTKKMKDGTPRKVCDDCGLYFNKHKRMRPSELWNQMNDHTLQSGPSESKRKAGQIDSDGAAPAGIRQSPRLNRTNSDSTTATLQTQTHTFPNIPESPRKRQRTGNGNKPVPQPSPRMATRASAKADTGTSNGAGDFSAEAFGFSPNTIFGTSPPDANGGGGQQSIGSVMASMTPNHNLNQNMNSNANSLSHFSQHIPGAAVGLLPSHAHSHDPNINSSTLDGDMDISALLAQMESVGDGFNFESLFAGYDGNGETSGHAHANNNNGTGMGNVDMGNVELSQEMMDLLAGWEGQIVAGLEADMNGNANGSLAVGQGHGGNTNSNTPGTGTGGTN